MNLSTISPNNSVYFCINGSCAGKENDTDNCNNADSAGSYLARFINTEDSPDKEKALTATHREEADKTGAVDVKINFIGDKLVDTNSNTPILEASLSSGIDHTHQRVKDFHRMYD